MNKVSKTEDRLYEAMLDIGLKPECQYPISRMKVDFAFPKEMLVIEVDGHYKRNSVGMKTLFERKRACEKEGWKVENFTAEEVFEDADKVARRIYYMVKDEGRKNKKLDNWERKKEPKRGVKSSKIISKEREEELRMIVEEVQNERRNKRIKLIPKKKNKKKIITLLIVSAILFFSVYYFLSNQNYKVTEESYNKLLVTTKDWTSEKGCQVCDSVFGKDRVTACGGVPKYDFISCHTKDNIEFNIQFGAVEIPVYVDIYTYKVISEKEKERRIEAFKSFLGENEKTKN